MYEFINEKLQETSLSQSVIPGSGPRHMIFSYDGKYCYLVNEIANSIMVYQYEDGHLILYFTAPNPDEKLTHCRKTVQWRLKWTVLTD